MTPWLYLQLDIQAIFNPDGNSNRNTILVLAFRTLIVF